MAAVVAILLVGLCIVVVALPTRWLGGR